MVVDITNDGQQSSTDPIMELDSETGKVAGQLLMLLCGINTSERLQVERHSLLPLVLIDSALSLVWTFKEMVLIWYQLFSLIHTSSC